MWYPSTVTEAPPVEPVTLVQAKDQCGILSAETYFDAKINFLIKAARSHAEEYCNARWAEQTIVSECDSFADFERLSEGPLKSVTSISYVDPAGETQTVDAAGYEAHKDGLEPSIGLKSGQVWPHILFGSRITLTAVYGGSVPESVAHAMLLFIADAFHRRENSRQEDWTVLDALLCNHRRGASW